MTQRSRGIVIGDLLRLTLRCTKTHFDFRPKSFATLRVSRAKAYQVHRFDLDLLRSREKAKYTPLYTREHFARDVLAFARRSLMIIYTFCTFKKMKL